MGLPKESSRIKEKIQTMLKKLMKHKGDFRHNVIWGLSQTSPVRGCNKKLTPAWSLHHYSHFLEIQCLFKSCLNAELLNIWISRVHRGHMTSHYWTDMWIPSSILRCCLPLVSPPMMGSLLPPKKATISLWVGYNYIKGFLWWTKICLPVIFVLWSLVLFHSFKQAFPMAPLRHCR